ncbi:MAG: hypothetical protein KKB34_13740 [Bacteroidetes bacterium]|nr:hypothetical protein [Bacteroidota bacterium]
MKFRYLLVTLLFIGNAGLQAQSNTHGDVIYRAKNVHAGNLIRVTFHNNGRLGGVKGDQSVTYSGEWPIGTGMVQMGNTSAYVMSELRLFAGVDPVTGDSLYEYVTPAIFCEGWDPNIFSNDSLGRFQGFEPLPGYLNLTQKEKDPSAAVAMSHQAYTWPAYWPDKMTDAIDPGWSGSWNGYFGKDQKNADEESYFVMDDYQYNKRISGLKLPKPLPDSEPTRNGLGLRLAVRGLQWSNPDAEDCLFWLYEIRNFGELFLDHTLFGLNVGASSGARITENTDYQDDGAKFYREKSLAVNFDQDNLGTGGYTPVPWVGFAFLESPGNPYDGIDNDGDGNNLEKPGGGTGKIINEIEDFYKFYAVGDDVVLIDYDSDNFERTIAKMPAGGLKFVHNGVKIVRAPNAPLEEIPRNGFDDNLNGLIDESDGAFTQDSVEFFLYLRSESNDRDYLAKNYFTNEGLDNLLIDERRDDLIDNDADWDSEFDDVGIDGKPGTQDQGEGDGVPTPGNGDLPGEPNIDQVDVDESDQIGLTSFKFYQYSTLTYSNDQQMWEFSRPGYFDNTTTDIADYDYVFTSGYFPLRPDQKEFFSIAMIYGWDETDILRNKDIVQKIYNSNYNFAIAPIKPKLTAVAGDGQITLYWDEGSEASFDRFLKEYDFEGYKIYKSTHYTFGDAGSITDGLGYERFKKPIAIYDKVDNIFGFFPKDFGTGVLFNLGNETGLVHSYVDNDVTNGVRYYYAVTAYDRGNIEKNIGPSETTIFLNVDQAGNIQLSDNVVAVTPQAPSSGYKDAEFDISPRLMGKGITSGVVGVNIIDPDKISNEKFEIHFIDQSMDKRDNDFDGLIDLNDPDEFLPTVTTGFFLKNITKSETYDTVWLKEYRENGDTSILIRDLYADRDGDPRTFSHIINGMELFVYNPDFGMINNSQLKIFNGVQWGGSIDINNTYNIKFSKFTNGAAFVEGTPYPRQYEVVFYDEIVDTSEAIGLPFKNGNVYPLKAYPVNFKVFDKLTGQELPFALPVDATVNKTITKPGFFSAKDRIILFERLKDGKVLITYDILNNAIEDTTFFNKYGRMLGTGDTLRFYPEIPFNNSIKYEFAIKGQSIDTKDAKESLKNIKVVPNPYVVTALWEPHNPYTTGRGPRLMQFIHLPQRCTIRIFAVDGTLVQKLEHDSAMRDGSESWDMMTMDNMDVAYGVYIYHIDAPGIGEHVGRMLIIK